MVAVGFGAIDKLSLTGGTMTGDVVLPGNPGEALGAIPRQYADAGFAAVVVYGPSSWPARPSTPGTVLWIGTTAPPIGGSGAAGSDVWLNSTAGSGFLTSLTAADTSVVVGGSGSSVTVRTNTLDVIAADHPPIAAWSNAGFKITSLGAGTAATDAANVGQIPRLTPTAVKTGAYTAAAGDFVPCDTTSAGFTVTLPSAPADGTVIGVKLIASAATVSTLTIARGGSDVFNKTGGSTSLPLTRVFQTVLLQYKASSGIWYVTGTDLAFTLDATAGDIKPTSTAAAAGSVGQPPDAGHVHAQNFGGLFGDGSDTGVTLDGSTPYAGFSSLAGSTYTLTADVFATSFAINSGVTLNPAGWRVFCQGAFSNAGTITLTGGAAAGATAGAASAAGTLNSGGAGAAGGTGAGALGTKPAGSAGTGSGGAGGSGSGGAGGGIRNPNFANTRPYRIPAAALAGIPAGVVGANTVAPAGAPGGSAGGGDGTGSGGGGGAGGGIIIICAWSASNSGTITVAGGNGGNGGGTNCGGGGGGGGGDVIVYTLAGWSNTGTVTLSGGTGGAATGTGVAGTAGGLGSLLSVIVL